LSLTLINAVRLVWHRDAGAERLRTSIDAILFWGSLTAILGFLGQWSGLHKAANAIYDYGVINPKYVVLGIGESLNTSVFGMFTLVGAAFFWFGLRLAMNRTAATSY
jgi:hypothetical protein